MCALVWFSQKPREVGATLSSIETWKLGSEKEEHTGRKWQASLTVVGPSVADSVLSLPLTNDLITFALSHNLYSDLMVQCDQ